MILIDLWAKFVNNRVIAAVRIFLAEMSVGLLISWLLLFSLELFRPGMVSLYFDLNIILAGGLASWLAGSKVKSYELTWYTSLIIFAIIIVLLALKVN